MSDPYKTPKTEEKPTDKVQISRKTIALSILGIIGFSVSAYSILQKLCDGGISGWEY